MPPKTRLKPMNGLQPPGNALLSKQLASISATLMNASKRRDTAAKDVATREASRPSTPMLSVRTPPDKLLVDYPFSSSLANGSTIVTNGVASDNSELGSTGGAAAMNVADKGTVEKKEIAPLGSPSVTKRRGGETIAEANDLESMFKELEERSGRSKAASEPSVVKEEEEEEDPDSLRDKFKKMLSPPPKRISADTVALKKEPIPLFGVGPTLERIEGDRMRDLKILHQGENDRKREVQILQQALYYATALQLGKAGVKWEVAQGWTAYLFSAGSSGHDAVREKHQLVQEATDELDSLIKQVLDEELAYWAKQEKNLFPCRLIVSNIAADADAAEVALFFSEFKYNIRTIKIIERDPSSRTQTACIDMYTKDAAKQASYTMGSIYGLMVKIRLAADAE